jgi:N-acetylglucosamine-6-phosphate deacetylase
MSYQALRVARLHKGTSSIPDTVRLLTLNPASMQKIDHERGMLTPGMKADVTVFDEDLNIRLTLVEGKIRYRRT